MWALFKAPMIRWSYLCKLCLVLGSPLGDFFPSALM